jgi:hypothetical protein
MSAGTRLPLAAVLLLAAVMSGHAAHASKRSGYDTPLSGTWVVSGCAPTSVPELGSFPISYTGRCLGEVTDSWTGYYVDDEQAVEDGSLSVHSHGVLTVYGKAVDGTCGSLRIRTTTATDGSTDALRSTARILSGTGDWVGSTGRYTTVGVFDTAVGEGTYQGSWHRPGKPRRRAAAECTPPTPHLS